MDFAERNEYEVNELKIKFSNLIDSYYQKYDEGNKGFLTEQEFGKFY